MAKPTKNRIVTGSACLNYVDNAIGFVSCATGQQPYEYRISGDLCTNFYNNTGENASMVVTPSDFRAFLQYHRYIEFTRFHHNNRVIGLILGTNDDGSYKIAVMGSERLRWGGITNIDGSSLEITIGTPSVTPDSEDKYRDFPGIVTYNGSGDIANGLIRVGEWENAQSSIVENPTDVKLDFTQPRDGNFSVGTFSYTGKYNNQKILTTGDHDFELSSDKTNTLILGCPISEILDNVSYNTHMFLYDTYNTIFDAWEGDWFDYLQYIYTCILGQSTQVPGGVISEGNRQNLFSRPDVSMTGDYAGYENKTHAFQFTPFNLILTKNEYSALEYLENGTLPSDAFLYPMDWQNLPRTDGTPEGDDQDPDYKPPSGENGDSGIDGTPTTDADPQITSNMLTNNNLYWLQAGQLESFITWFWQNAGEIIEVDDLWDRIKGLYNDLASAIINIRYFPVDPYYIGGVSDTTNIVLSSIEMPISGIKKLNKTKLRKRTLGEISIPNKYNAFTDYSPYTSLMLYLPFHGWIDLDIDIFTGNKLQVRCVYDHISGTIQYGVYVISKGKEFLLNTVIAKMAVDIPITLQSKNDRDSAIFNNVTNAFGNLLGAGASAVSGNPIGLVMSTAGVASSGTQSAPLKVNGTVGETGAFFMPNKCAVYIKRPSYNRPKNYGSRVGFPSNKGGKLSEFSGFTTVYNPQITFSGNTNADNVTIKPLQSEIDEIYTALEKGVIL